jgi:hypothetical protein
MRTHAVALDVIPYVKVPCKFWLDDDVWTGSAEELGVTVHAAGFEQTKIALELDLGLFVE